MDAYRYLIALGSNMRHHRHGSPRRVLSAAVEALGRDFAVEAVSPVIETPPLGHSRRRYANAVALVRTGEGPDEVLHELGAIERRFGRKPGGRPWSARVLDLDIVLWSGGAWTSDELVVPHPAFRKRSFVLVPAARIAGPWRDPLTSLAIRHLHARLTKRRPIPS